MAVTYVDGRGNIHCELSDDNSWTKYKDGTYRWWNAGYPERKNAPAWDEPNGFKQWYEDVYSRWPDL